MITLPVYETKLPIENKALEFTPLVVKEEKAIAAAKDTGKKEDSYRTFLKILADKINFPVVNLCETDLIHLILEMRKRSIGETVKFSFNCPQTKEPISIEINCNDIKLKGSNKTELIKVGGYAIHLQVPKKKSQLWSAIKSIQTQSEKISFDDMSDDQKEDLLHSLPIIIKNEIELACDNLLHYEYTISYRSGESDRTLSLRSAEDFFTLFFAM